MEAILSTVSQYSDLRPGAEVTLEANPTSAQTEKLRFCEFLVNPRHTCAARVTVLGLCVCVCVSVCLSTEISYLAQLRVKQETNNLHGIKGCFVLKCFVRKLEHYLLTTARIGRPFCCTYTNVTHVFICTQIGVGLDAGAVNYVHALYPSPSHWFTRVCIRIYLLRIAYTRVCFIHMCYCAEGLHFSAFTLSALDLHFFS